MQLTPANLQALQVNFDARFQRGFDNYQVVWPKIAEKIEQLEGDSTLYGFMDRLPRAREWVGDRVYHNLVARDVVLKPKDYELTIEVGRNAILDDKLGVFMPKIEMIGMEMAKAPDVALKTVMQGGTSHETYDGQDFFSTSHPANVDKPTQYPVQSNLFTSRTLSSANYALTRADMQSLLGADGLPLGVKPNILAVPPQLEYTARTILEAELNAVPVGSAAASQTNVLKNTAEVVVFDELADEPAVWYRHDPRLPVKPFINVERQPVQLVQLMSPTDPNVFERKMFRYGADSRFIVSYGLWFLAARCGT